MGKINDINWLFNKYYGENPELRRIVTVHSEEVAKKALEICKRKNLDLNEEDVYCAAMLHDIGVVKCNAPDIHAYGELPYIKHGIEGGKILRENGLSRWSSICETHTGAGISKEEVKNQNLPLPNIDMLPETILEKLICYADKFFSKSHDLKREKTVEEIMSQMSRHGEDSLARFLELHSLFS